MSSEYQTGIFLSSDNRDHWGIVQIDNSENVIIIKTPMDANKALQNDTVKIYNNKIIEIISRANHIISGVLYGSSRTILGFHHKNKLPMKLFKPRFSKQYPNFKVTIPKAKIKYYEDWYVIIKFNNWDNDQPIGTVINNLGIVGDSNAEKRYLCASWNINQTKWKQYIDMSIDLTPNRRDFTNIKSYSIDPNGCQDIDDALSLMTYDGKNVLGIHISDPTSWIIENSELDLYLRHRAQTTYFPWERIDMIPPQFIEKSDNCASLHESHNNDTYRRAISVLIDEFGNLCWIGKSFVNVVNINYDDAKDMIQNKNKYLVDMYNFCKKMYNNTNLKIVSRIDQHIDTHFMVEIAMILANCAVGKYMIDNNPNMALFRIHDGEPLNISNNEHDISKMIHLVTMKRAEYSIGTKIKPYHGALQLDNYTHFTSPIRRYADMWVHRRLTDIFYKTNIDQTINKQDFINSLNKQCRNVDNAMRDAQYLKLVDDLQKYNKDKHETDVWIIGINDNKLLLFSSKWDIVIDYKIFSKKVISHNIIRSTLSIQVDNVVYKIGQKLHIYLIIRPKSTVPRRKFIIKLLDDA